MILPFETEFRRDERIIRFLSTKMDKHHIAYAEGRRNKSNRQKLPLLKQKATLRLNLSRYGRQESSLPEPH